MKNIISDEMILRRIAAHKPFSMDSLKTKFNEREQETIVHLLDEGLLIVTWNDEIPHQDFQELQLTQKGRAILFKSNYSSLVSSFCDQLVTEGYDASLLDGFLL